MSEQQKSIDAVVRKLREERYRPMTEDGEVSLPLLGCMLDTEEGWVGQVMQNLHGAFGDTSPDDTASKLEDTAAILIAWAADIRRRSKPAFRIPSPGEPLLVRIPGHRPSFMAEALEGGQAWVEALDRSFPIGDLVLLPMPKAAIQAPGRSRSLQNGLGAVMAQLTAASMEPGNG
jgi:hypothetical protein